MRQENPNGTVFIFVLASFHTPDLQVFSETELHTGEIYCLGFEPRHVT